MDLCLNISSTPIVKKLQKISTLNNNNNNIKKTISKPKQNTFQNPSFEFKWDSSAKVKPAFVKKKVEKDTNIFPKRQNIPPPKVSVKTNILPKTQNVSPPKLSVETNIPPKQQNVPTPKMSIEKKNGNVENTKTAKETPNIANKARKENNSKTSTVENKKNQTNLTEKSDHMSQFKKHGFPLFNKHSEAARGSTFSSTDGKSSVEQVFSSEGTTFDDLDIHPHTTTNLERMGLKILTAVQETSIPAALEGKNLFVRSQTGSGKTLVYAIPIVESLRSIDPHISRKDGVQAVIVVPTRELALQTYELFLKLVEPFRWLVPGTLCGGENRSTEKARLRKGINILVGTPGRLLDHILHTRNLRLDKVRCLVLDEADRLLDMGFQKDVNRLVELIDEARNVDYDPIALMKSQGKVKKFIEKPSNAKPPLKDINSKERQTMLLSATLTSNVKDLATFTMKEYLYVDPLNANGEFDATDILQQQRTNEVVVPESVKQEFIVTDVKTRLVVLAAFIVSKASENKNCKMFIFMASRQMVEFHELLFKKSLVTRPKREGLTNNMIAMDEEDSSDDDENSEEDVLDIEFFKLHGSMDQKERVEVFKSFRDVKKGVLLCTDVAARGVDIPHADYVVQYTGPLQDDDYIHRVGRTGRAGKKGHALLFLTEPELNYIAHLKEKNLYLQRENQDSILEYLLPFMEHMSPGSVQSAAEYLQRRFEKAVDADKSLQRAACYAYSTWSRYYSSYPVALRTYFNIKSAHLGHYVTSFALRMAPQEVGRYIRRDIGKTERIRLNKKLDNHEMEEEKFKKPKKLAPKKRPRSQELVISEFDSGLEPIKKKKK